MRSLEIIHQNNCPRCPIIGGNDVEADRYHQLLSLRFDIRLAHQLCRSHLAVRQDRRAVARWLAQIGIDENHVGHLPDNLGPGIIVTLPMGCGMPIIDGNHRAARALREGKDFFAFVLSESETLELLRSGMGNIAAEHYWKRLSESVPGDADDCGNEAP